MVDSRRLYHGGRGQVVADRRWSRCYGNPRKDDGREVMASVGTVETRSAGVPRVLKGSEKGLSPCSVGGDADRSE